MDKRSETEEILFNNTKKGQEESKYSLDTSQKDEYYENLALTIKSMSLQSKRNIGKILITGENLLSTYNSIKNVFPNAYYVVSNESQTKLDQFTKQIDLIPLVKMKKLDIFNGSSLTDFYLEFGKFDLILLSELLEKNSLNYKKIRSSVIFLHKNFLNINGILSILNGETELTEGLIKSLKKVRAVKKVIETQKKRDNSLKYLILTKKNRLKLFGE